MDLLETTYEALPLILVTKEEKPH